MLQQVKNFHIERLKKTKNSDPMTNSMPIFQSLMTSYDSEFNLVSHRPTAIISTFTNTASFPPTIISTFTNTATFPPTISLQYMKIICERLLLLKSSVSWSKRNFNLYQTVDLTFRLNEFQGTDNTLLGESVYT